MGEGRKEEFNGRGHISRREFISRGIHSTNVFDRSDSRPDHTPFHLSFNPPPPFSTSGPDPLISPHPFTPLSSVSSCTKPSVILSATETVTGLRIRSAPCPRNSNHYDAHVNSNRRANTEAARTTREISTPNPSSFYPLPPLPPPPPLDYTEYSFNPLVQFSIGEQINRREGRIGEGRGWLLWIARL